MPYQLEKPFLAEKDYFLLITGELKETILHMYNFSALRLYLVDLILPLNKYLKCVSILLIF